MSVIRRAEISDSGPINAVSAALGYEVVAEDVVQQWVEGLLASDEHRVWVYEVDHNVVAWLHALRSARLASAPFIEIAGLAVDPNHRREGIG